MPMLGQWLCFLSGSEQQVLQLGTVKIFGTSLGGVGKVNRLRRVVAEMHHRGYFLPHYGGRLFILTKRLDWRQASLVGYYLIPLFLILLRLICLGVGGIPINI